MGSGRSRDPSFASSAALGRDRKGRILLFAGPEIAEAWLDIGSGWFSGCEVAAAYFGSKLMIPKTRTLGHRPDPSPLGCAT